jgi:hypothetical protein
MRYQVLAGTAYGLPIFVTAKGPSVQFTAGAPLSMWAPEREGFERLPGVGMFMHGRSPCEGSLR